MSDESLSTQYTFIPTEYIVSPSYLYETGVRGPFSDGDLQGYQVLMTGVIETWVAPLQRVGALLTQAGMPVLPKAGFSGQAPTSGIYTGLPGEC
jgi:hypothetical protein